MIFLHEVCFFVHEFQLVVDLMLLLKTCGALL
jgi:hypothetical protein